MLQNFKTKTDELTHNFPCKLRMLASCEEYGCFGTSVPACNADFACNSEVVSITTVSRESWLQSALISSAQVHNFDMLAIAVIALVYFTYKHGCCWLCHRDARNTFVHLEQSLLSAKSNATLDEELTALSARLAALETAPAPGARG